MRGRDSELRSCRRVRKKPVKTSWSKGHRSKGNTKMQLQDVCDVLFAVFEPESRG